MTTIHDVLARVGPGLFQQAFVVEDLEQAQAALTRTTGCRTWATMPALNLPYRYRGREVECAIELAFARSGNQQIELLRPVSGEGIHVEFLERHGPGAHHLGFMVDALDDELTIARAAGIDEVMAGQFGNLRFAYLDTWDALTVYVELVEDPDGLMAQLMPGPGKPPPPRSGGSAGWYRRGGLRSLPPEPGSGRLRGSRNSSPYADPT